MELNIISELPSSTNIDVIICLGSALNNKNELTWTLESRVKKAVEIFQAHPNALFILAGGKYYLDKTDRPPEAEVMFEYINEHYSLDLSKIITDTETSSTVDQLYMLKTKFAIPNNWQSIAIVSDEFHLIRTSVAAYYMFGDEYTLYFVGSEINLGGKYRELIERHEQADADLFIETYTKKGFKPGDHETIHTFAQAYKKKMAAHVENGGDRLKPIKI
jgi:vancomycin permeability regulator SanA